MGIFFAVLIACVCVFCACFFQGCERKPDKTTTVESVKNMSKAEIEIRLKSLEVKKVLPPPPVMATCYIAAPPRPTAEYLCPVCGEKTIHSTKVNTVEAIALFRREFNYLKKTSKLKVELDESSFCRKCQPEAKKSEFVLKITYGDGTVHVTKGVSILDLSKLSYFFENGSYMELLDRNDAPRLRELLGMKNEEVKK